MLRRLAAAVALSLLLGWSAAATSPPSSRPRRRWHSRSTGMDDGAAAAAATAVAGLSDEIDIHAPDALPGVLALPGRKFPLNFGGGGFTIRGKPVVIQEVYNSGQGTGLTIWDGAVVLAKYLERMAEEQAPGSVAGKTVLELGAGTGVVGLAAAAAGATTVYLTDLAYTLNNTAGNAAANAAALGDADVRTAELDWTRPALPPGLAHVDVIVAADVVWVTELIPPLVRTLAFLCGRALAHTPRPPVVLLAHQTRSRAGDELLFRLLAASGFAAAEVPRAQHHPDFRDDAIAIWRLTWVGRGHRDGGDAER